MTTPTTTPKPRARRTTTAKKTTTGTTTAKKTTTTRRRTTKKKIVPWWKKLLKIPFRFWRSSLILAMFLLGGFITNLDRASNYLQRLEGLKKFMPKVVAELIFPPEEIDFGIAKANQTISGVVTRVIDGDTFIIKSDINNNEVSYRVRMWGIDAPESSQEFGDSSTKALSEKILNKQTTIKVITNDRYARQLCVVYGSDGEDINKYMVENGYAWYYAPYGQEAQYLASAEQLAKYYKRGLWTYPAPIQPWEYRKQLKKQDKK